MWELWLGSLALCGFLTVLANLTGVAAQTRHGFPFVADLPDTMTTTLFLTAFVLGPRAFCATVLKRS